MPLNYDAAKDEMLGIVKSVIDANYQDCFGSATVDGDVRWPGNQIADPVPMDRFWMRPSTQIVKDGQASLSATDGSKIYHAIGLLYVQLFCPRTEADPVGKGVKFLLAMQAAFRKQSPSGEIWFREQKITELPSSSENYPINFVTTFEYDNIQ